MSLNLANQHNANRGALVIEFFGGELVSDVDEPPKPIPYQYSEKGHQNAIRALNKRRRYSRIREILRGMGYQVPENTSSTNVLRIGAPFVGFLT